MSDSIDSQPKPAIALITRCVVTCCLLLTSVFAQEERDDLAAGPSKPVVESQEAGQEKPAAKNQQPAKPEPDETPKQPAPVTKVVTDDLLAPPIERTWQLFAAETGVKMSDVWTVVGEGKDRKLVCNGKQKGYLRTRAPYKDYKLTFDFRFFAENGNSGVLLHVDGKDKIWPDAVQVQLHRPTAGSIIPSGNRKIRFTVGAKLEWAVQKWNTCVITVRDDTVEVSINGLAVGPLKYCDPCKGFIALQSEGSEVHFRNLKLEHEKLVTPPAPTPPVGPDKPGKDKTATVVKPAQPSTDKKTDASAK